MASAPFDWNNYFQLADELAKRSEEAALRTAISRAYYYVYHLALKRATSNSYAFNKDAGEGMHMQLWRVFDASPEPDSRRLFQIGVRMKDMRERADYKPSFARISDAISAILSDAKEFEATLNRLPARHPVPKPPYRR
jgi:uncharacterized protein (UPF0332 family)